jgi:5-methylcytosine-specific restriction endonuclease McrA
MLQIRITFQKKGQNLRVFVKNLRNQSLMPTTPRKAKLLLREKKAKVVCKLPFTIKLTVATGEAFQAVVAGMDTGSNSIGCAAIANKQVIYQSEIQIRQDVSKKMQSRKMYRRTRRGRKTRYRPARWNNRAFMKTTDRLAPSIKSKVDSHLREKAFVESILPINNWIVETASFDIHKITNPDVKGKGYQFGDQKDFYNVKAYVLHRDGYKCQSKQKIKHTDKLHVHHNIFKSNGGTDTPSNLITLCEVCHKSLHEENFVFKVGKTKTKHATEIGIIKSQLKKLWDFTETFGYETKFFREQVLKLDKNHHFDAVAICGQSDIILSDSVFYKKHVSGGDYQQTHGSMSEKKIPTGKLFGLRKFDLVKTDKGIGFIKGKRSSGYFALMDIFNNTVTASVNVRNNCQRLIARTTTMIQEGGDSSPTLG